VKTYDEILDTIEGLQIIDTHEHLPARESARPPQLDALSEYLTHYFSCDLISAGLPDGALSAAQDSTRDLMERWDSVEPYWNAARSTGYGRALELAARDLYGIPAITRETIADLNKAFLAARERGGHYEYVLKDKSRIAISVLDANPDCDPRYFVTVVRADDFVMPGHRADVKSMGARVGMRVHRLADWEEAMRLTLSEAFAGGAVAIKCGLAYQRSLHFPKADYAAAERDFNELFAERNSPGWRTGIKVGDSLQNYMMHAMLRLADQQGCAVQIHTGLQEGNGNVIADANPAHLANLFLEYGDVRFDIFHMGYPYVMELGVLAKNFRNVNIDMCWGHIISPEAARRALVEWLDAVPANKINAFGGDFCFVDGVYGHQYLARRNVAAALAQKVEDGSFDLDRAKQIARWLFVDNPARILGLSDRLSATAAAPARPRPT